MRTLLNEQFAPVTSSPGYLRLGLEEAVDALVTWRRTLTRDVTVEELSSGFPACLRSLEPLTGGIRPRELLVQASDGWTAYFDCGLRGTDPIGTVAYLARTVGCHGLAIDVVPHTRGLPGLRHGGYGAVQFEMFGPSETAFLNYERTIAVAHDGGKWVFIASGTEQWFEETSAYQARRVRDRFTSDMLERYCQALELDIFNAAAYGPRAILVRSHADLPADAYVMSLDEVQRWLEIVPGQGDRLPG